MLAAASVVFCAAVAAPARADYYYCPAGLLSTGTADELANGSNCAYWLLPSFPSPTTGAPIPGLDVLSVWQRTQGAGVTVAVLDTGVDSRQNDLGPNLLPGWNVFDGNADTTDGAGHGTLLASIIAAAGGNGGYVGIAPQAKILPIKMMAAAPGRIRHRHAPSATRSLTGHACSTAPGAV